MIQRNPPSPKPSRLLLIDEFFMGTAPLHATVERLTKKLSAMQLPFAICGALAVNYHGHLRATQDLDVLMRLEDLKRFKDENIGLGWLEKFEGSKGFIDTLHKVPIDVLITGDYPGDGKPKAICFPDPSDLSLLDISKDGLPFLCLEKVVELKLASGLTSPGRIQDFADVIALIKKNDLPQTLGDQLHPYVTDAWNTYWDAAQEDTGEY